MKYIHIKGHNVGIFYKKPNPIDTWLKENNYGREIRVYRYLDPSAKEIVRISAVVAFDDGEEDLMIQFKLVWAESIREVTDTLTGLGDV